MNSSAVSRMAVAIATIAATVSTAAFAAQPASDTSHASADTVRATVGAAIRPIMAEYKVPGMAVAVTVAGRHRIFNYGVASKESGQPVTDDTIFEIGSVSKTFAATLAAYAQARGAISFNDKAVKYLPALAGSAFDGISLLELGTYTSGGLPLQVPDGIADMSQMVDWFRQWRPDYAPGTIRRYSNPSIGLFGYLAAQALQMPFETAISQQILPKLGLRHTWIHVPAAQMEHYAWGYAKDDKPVRVGPGVFDEEAYGIKTTAADMIRFVELNIDGEPVSDPALRQALRTTHAGYFQVGKMTQGLGWERYAWPTSLDDLLVGNNETMVMQANPARRIAPPQPAPADVLLNKTGATDGFGAYAAFVPGKRIGVVMLGNRNMPIPARVKAAHRILEALLRYDQDTAEVHP